MVFKFDVSPEEFATFNVVTNSVWMVTNFLLVPLLSQGLGWHDSVILCIALAFGGSALASAAFSSALIPYFLLSYAVSNIRHLCSPVGRSLLAKVVEASEVAKIYAVVNLLQYGTGFFASPFYRLVYDATLSSLPSTVFLLSSGFLYMSALTYLFIISQRRKLRQVGDATHTERDDHPS